MTERIGQSNIPSTEIVKVKGNFNLHIPMGTSLVPDVFPAHLASRHYEGMIDNRLLLKHAELGMTRDPETNDIGFVGSIDFAVPSMYQRSYLDLGPLIQKRLYKQLDTDYHGLRDRKVSHMSLGEDTFILISDDKQPAVWAGVEAFEDTPLCRVGIKARFADYESFEKQSTAIISVAERWVELQEAIVSMVQAPDQGASQHDIHLDSDRDTRVSEIEFSLMEIMTNLNGLDVWVPEWGDDIDSRVLALEELLIADSVSKQDVAFELINTIRERNKVLYHSQQLDQRAIIEALGKFVNDQS